MGTSSRCIVDGLGHYLSGDVSEVLGIIGLTQEETDGDFDAMAQSANMGSLHYWLDCG
jgi:hypothetical protein